MPKPVYIGYFPFAVDVTLTDPKPSSTHRPTEDMKLLLRFEYSMLNAWVLDYLPGMCDDLKLMYRLDETDTYQLQLCRLLPRGNLSNALPNGKLRYHRSRSLTLSTGYHILRIAPVYVPHYDGGWIYLCNKAKVFSSRDMGWTPNNDISMVCLERFCT